MAPRRPVNRTAHPDDHATHSAVHNHRGQTVHKSPAPGSIRTPHGPDRHAAIIRARRCEPAAAPVGMIGDGTVTAPNEPPTASAATAGAPVVVDRAVLRAQAWT